MVGTKIKGSRIESKAGQEYSLQRAAVEGEIIPRIEKEMEEE